MLNAFTGKEYTCYYAKVLAEHLPVPMDLLADMFLHSSFDPEEIERERTVVLQEISQIEDTPDDYVHDLFNLTFWPGPSARPPDVRADRDGRDVSARGLHGVLRGALSRRTAIIVAAAGNLTHERLVDWVSAGVRRPAGPARAW